MKNHLFFLVLVITGCSYTHQKNAGEVLGQGTNDINCTAVDFSLVQREIFGTPTSPAKCLGCHGAGSGLIALDSYSAVKSNLAGIESAIMGNRMPKGNPLSENLKQLLAAWVGQSAPEFVDPTVAPEACGAGDVGAGSPPPILEPNYESLKVGVFSGKCLGCHSSDPLAQSSFDFSTYDSTVSYKKLFKIPEVGDSRFVKALVSGYMPQGGTPLSDEQIQVIREWVFLGMPENNSTPPSTVPALPVAPPIPPIPSLPPIATPDLKCLDYKFIRTQILEKKCTGCHGTKGGVNLESYANFKLHMSKVEPMVSTDAMPPSKPLDADLKKYLLEWIKDGAPETLPTNSTCSPPNAPPLAPLSENYNSIREHFLEAKCIVCHSPSRKGGGQDQEEETKPDFSSYKAMIEQQWLFDFEKPHKSQLMEVIYDGEMPPPNSSAKALTPVEAKILLDWIKNGVPES